MTVIGIRPDFIRMSQVIRLLDHQDGIEHIFVHTGQHYSYAMDKVFFDELEVRAPDENLGVGSGSHAQQTARLLVAAEGVIQERKPDLCLFLGDSNAALAALAAAKLNVRVAHIEAGMRSFDRRMPEEKNRILVDHLSDYLFVYTPRYQQNLIRENVPEVRVFVVGNPIVDVIDAHRSRAEGSSFLVRKALEPGAYILATLHRQENVDDRGTLIRLLDGLRLISDYLKLPVVYPMSYRTATRIREFNVPVPQQVRVMEPLGFLDFLKAEIDAALIVTDSGTVQEEASILQVPCVVPRASTERPETVEVGGCIVAGTNPSNILDAARTVLARPRSWQHVLGDGKTSPRIVETLVRLTNQIASPDPIVPSRETYVLEAFSPYVREATAPKH